MTDRLYYTDAYLSRFTARVTGREADRVYLDRSAFYPASGGQPHDTGLLSGIPVTAVADEGDRVAHVLAEPLAAESVEGQIDWPRRFDFMQQHTGQHLLSAVLHERFGLGTVSVHLGEEASTIDIETASITPAQIIEAERAANETVFENRPVTVSFEDAAAAAGLRKASGREGALRIVTIADLDRSACGGTHVRATGEIGPVSIRRLDKVRGIVRVGFLCGTRAVRRARLDFDALARVAQIFSAPLDEAAALTAAQRDALKDAARKLRAAETELARHHGRELYASAEPAAGLRLAVLRRYEGAPETLRALAHSFCEQPGALLAASLADPPSVLYAASADTGIDAGAVVRAVLAQAGGRGGGNARLAQGSVPDAAALDSVVDRLINACEVPAPR
ncbi:MAG: alanyl-tRNA editing protein [Bryobacterales bacterium]|nr:alanyl-tRNA editing protein [Bryobacterales bacterium]